tara:strand:+ start:468 stop:647 length:180 start_codon:yes stop_codon:yes gene_type:complete
MTYKHIWENLTKSEMIEYWEILRDQMLNSMHIQQSEWNVDVSLNQKYSEVTRELLKDKF